MRRLFALLLVCLLPLLTGCQSAAVQADDRIQVVATVFPQYDFARAIGGDAVDVTLLLAAGQEMHNYEPTPLDAAEISQCDIFLRIGGESEVWTDTLLDALHAPQMQVVTLMDCIPEPVMVEHNHASHNHGAEEHEPEEHAEACTEDHDHAAHEKDVHEEEAHEHHEEHMHFDEHIWNSPVNAMAMVETVCDALCAAAPEKEETFRQRADAYLAELAAIDQGYRELAESCEDPILVVADKFPFRYLTAEYGFSFAAAFSGCSSETEPTVAAFADLLTEIEHHEIQSVFYLEFSSRKIADRVHDITGADSVMLRPGHNVGAEDLANGTTFLDLTRYNYELIKEALS